MFLETCSAVNPLFCGKLLTYTTNERNNCSYNYVLTTQRDISIAVIIYREIQNLKNFPCFFNFSLWTCALICQEAVFNKENLAHKHILPLSNTNLAPVTNQWPGLSCGPLHNCEVSTNFNSFCVCTGTGGPVGNTLESKTTTGFFWSLPEIDVLITEKMPDLCDNPEEPCVQLDFTTTKLDTLENISLRWSTLLESCFFTWSWAPVTIKATSLSELQLGSYFTGAVHTWENFFPLIASKKRSSLISSDHNGVSSILSLSIVGVFNRCCTCMANLCHQTSLWAPLIHQTFLAKMMVRQN